MEVVMDWITNWDLSVLSWIQETFQCAGADRFFSGITHLADGGALWIFLAVLFLIFPKTRRLGLAMAAALLADLLLCNLLLKPLVARPRPFDLDTTIALLIPKPTDYSFPSGHTAASFTAAFALVFSNGPRTIISSIIAFWIGGFINVEIISFMKKVIRKDGKVQFFLRASFSTLIGQLVDNALFMVLAFAPVGLSLYEMMWKDIISSVIIGTAIELLIESCMVPFVTIPLSKHISKIKALEEGK